MAARVAAADPKHPLRRRWKSSHFRWIRERQTLELSQDTNYPPWLNIDRSAIKIEIGATGRENAYDEYQRWALSRIDKILDLTVFSDGAMNEEGNAGAAFCIFRGPQEEISNELIPLGHTVEVYDAEIHVALKGLRAALNHSMAKYATNLVVCLDNEEAAIRFHTGIATPSSSKQILEFQKLRCDWENRPRSRVSEAGNVSVRWVPGHTGIRGNERADMLAKNACNIPSTRTQVSAARARRLNNNRYETNLSDYWRTSAPNRYKYLDIKISS